jgi:hypothetical protein
MRLMVMSHYDITTVITRKKPLSHVVFWYLAIKKFGVEFAGLILILDLEVPLVSELLQGFLYILVCLR